MNIIEAMRSVRAILDDVYGGLGAASVPLGTNKSAPWNWSKWGHFPANVALKIFEDAKRKGVALELSDIPTLDRKRAQ